MIPSFWKIAFVVSIIRKNSNTIKKHNYPQSLNTKKTTTFPNGNTSHLRGYLQENQKLSRRNEPLNRNESGRFGSRKIWFNPPFLWKCLYQVRVITVFSVFRLLTDFVCLYTYEFWLSLWKIVRSSVILLLPLSR